MLRVPAARPLRPKLYENAPPDRLLRYETRTSKSPLLRKKLSTNTFGKSFRMLPRPLVYQKSALRIPPRISSRGPAPRNIGHVTTAPIIHALPEKQQHVLMRELLNSRDPSLRFIASAWTRKQTDDVFLSNRKSMTLRFYAHSSRKRTEGIALLDSGATENFMSLEYAKWLGLPIKRLPKPRTLLNVDGTLNKQGKLEYYVDLQVQTGSQRQNMRFFLSNLGEQKAILGTPGSRPYNRRLTGLKAGSTPSNSLSSPSSRCSSSPLPPPIGPTQTSPE